MRNIVCLNGKWDFMPLYGINCCLDLPEKLIFEDEKISVPSSWRYSTPTGDLGIVDDFQPFNLFNYPEKWNQAETGVYRKTFNLKDNILQDNLFLKFHGLMEKSRIYLNRTIAADWNESYLPLEIDISKLVKRDGSLNELLVVCTEFDKTVIPSGQTKTLGLKGSWFGYLCRGIWQDVFLESRPLIFIEDVHVITSVKNKNIHTNVSIKSTHELPSKVTLKLIISNKNKVVKTILKENENLVPASDMTITILDEWLNPILWDIDNPYLYNMKIEILSGNLVIDSKEIKFGFREIWTEGNKFILNGTRINLRGDSWHFQGAVQQTKDYALNWYKMCREKGLNFIRLHAEPHPEYYLEAADEVGMLIVDETAIYGSSKNMDAAHPVYLDNCKKHIQRLVKRDKNHPSIIMWSLQNEMRWVDGRDTYKEHIPEMMEIIKNLDNTRPIILEGDNRLLGKAKTEIESRHYNIDGTIAQWDRNKPLVFGEHGGWWYISPQNTSAYNGAKTYLSLEASVKGAALKERLYVEYARRAEVSGITSFNFAHYLMQSMPKEDIPFKQNNLNSPGIKPKVIRKLSLTINNGLLKNYPSYIPNTAMPILAESYKPVTILASEYNTFFFDGEEIIRNFDIYNDTLNAHRSKVNICIKETTGEVLYENTFEFSQLPGERQNIEVKFTARQNWKDIREIYLEAALYHRDEEVYRLNIKYKLCPKNYKTEAIDMQSKKILYLGKDKTFGIIKALAPNSVPVKAIDESLYSYDILIIGDYLTYGADKYQGLIGAYLEKGGIVLQLEQSSFAVGEINIFKQNFFSAHITSKDNCKHPILNNLCDEDLIFWKPHTNEETPESIMNQVFIKPVKGDFNMLLECNSGDFGDGGDLWTPLIEYKHNLGLMLLNQLEIIDNYNSVPQACLLLRNMLSYAANYVPVTRVNTCLIAAPGSAACNLLKSIGLEFDILDTFKVSNIIDMKKYQTLVIDPDAFTISDIEIIQTFTKNGGKTIILPSNDIHRYSLENLLQSAVEIKNNVTYQLKTITDNCITRGLPITDLFRFEKIYLSPRLVENIPICTHSIEITGDTTLLGNVTNTPWHDYFVRELSSEYSRIAVAQINKEKDEVMLPYVIEKLFGKGIFILSQVSIDCNYEKNIRFYSRLLGNLNCYINHKELFTYEKSEKDYAVDYFMTLPHEEYKDYKAAEEYYSDSSYSLNNLGEGLYGWMKKIEKDKGGFINIKESQGRTFFLSCFINNLGNKNIEEVQADFQVLNLEIYCNSKFKLWVNGELLMQYSKAEINQGNIILPNVKLLRGLNRFIISAAGLNEDIKLRAVFKNLDGTYPDFLRYVLTIDEVDPK